ncbi:hypothetical protein Cob_v009318 [Colletotrichum orbiculare MAFF 240422]|uniref:Uncharacterized protein n=1 Tax=Colletotrichum orbiculare (strain 104-T / ATCC 96160 / CBS 514.97 / LARS 414 / MAFF 240422) TaxID=1213857 RepID=A0A484FHY6_COLOR|nr:hypothetical protein Cob_v009318 [Colletotrichum orbiculare MAFF 240422]
MARLRKCRRATVLSMLLASAQAASLPVIFQRQETCAAQGFSPCGNGLPASFCCQAGATCITLVGNSTVLCCPEGTNCDRISPITCNVSLQDPEAHPDAVIKTTALKSKLTTCGTRCCPFGYDCNGADQCVKKADQSELPSELPASELPTSTPGPTSSVAIPTVIPTIIATTSPETTEPGTSSPSAPAQQGGNDGGNDGGGNKNTFPTAIVIGVLCGILAGVGIGVALLIFLSRRRRNAAVRQNEKKRSRGPRPSTSTSSFGNIISEPIPTSDSAFRTDFILKTPSTGTSTFSPTKRPGQAHFRNSSTTTLAHDPIGLARSDSKPRTPDRNNISVAPIRGMRPNSGRRPPAAQNPLLAPPPQQLQREPSSESINVFADPVDVLRPGQRRMTSATTFTDLMDEADLGDVRRGKPFVPQTPKTPGRR